MGRQGALCPVCWGEVEFITASTCRGCGLPLHLDSSADGPDLVCDSCLTMPRPWGRAQAAITYTALGRRLVLALKHGDRPDLAVTLGRWLADAARPLIHPEMLVVPVPLHPWRLLRRRYNQAALLGQQAASRHGLRFCPNALVRHRHTPMQEHRSLAERFDNQRGAIALHRKGREQLAGRPVLLVDDVMASGATLMAAADVLLEAGAASVDVAILARALPKGPG